MNTNEQIGNRIRSRREELSLTLKDVSEKIGVASSTIMRYENGTIQKIKIPIIDSIAKALNVDPSWLCGKSNTKSLFFTENPNRINVLGKIAAGIPIDAIENIADQEELDPRMALKGEYFGLIVKGCSMEPRIYENDVVIVRRQSDVESGDIAVVLANGDNATVKKIIKSNNGITLVALNTSVYDPIFYSNEDIEKLPVDILGKVVEVRGKLE